MGSPDADSGGTCNGCSSEAGEDAEELHVG